MHLNEKNKSIEEILQKLSCGDVSFLDNLYSLIKTDIYAYALSKVKNKFDVDDIIQDTIITIYKNSKLYVPKGKPMAWIMTIENNIINKSFNEKNKIVEFNEELLNESTISDDTKNYYEDDFLNKLLNKLQNDEKEIITLHIISELKFREIADILDKPLATILSKYNRAIKKIQNFTKEEQL